MSGYDMQNDRLTGDRVGTIQSEGQASGNRAYGLLEGVTVRRLTPLECLRLQGLPDDWLDGLGLSDSVKYRMIGNGGAVPVMEWIGRRLLAEECRMNDALPLTEET